MKKYDVFRNKKLMFTGNKNESKKFFDRLNKFLEYCDDIVVMTEHNDTITDVPVYDNYNEFKKNSYYSRTCFNDLNGMYDSYNKYTVKDNKEIRSIIDSSPNNADLNFLDITNVTKLPKIKPNMILKWDTSNITRFSMTFSYSNNIHEQKTPYQYDLDWVFIAKEATALCMFKDTKFNKKLPRTENRTFDDFVNETCLIVTPELLKNNNISIDTWCKNKHNQKLMKTNKLYEPMLEYWLNSDFITTEEKIEAMKESGIEIFEI